MSFAGRYINMDASPGRRAALEARLAAVGQGGRYQRFAAVDGRAVNRSDSPLSAGEFGCMLSHLACVAEAAGRDTPTHIIEDDVVFTPLTTPILDQVLGDALNAWDMLFCDIFVPMHAQTLHALLSLYRKAGLDPDAPAGGGAPQTLHYLPLGGIPFAGSASYVISPAGARKLEPLIAAHLDGGSTMPVDTLFQVLCSDGRIKAACAVPFLTSVDPEAVFATTIADRDQDQLSALAFYLLRSHFFIGRDQARTAQLAGRLTQALDGGEDMKSLMTAIHFILSDRFKLL
jgi:GR25 family glycosyltransferase involved in LPS biosynthesis